jgi:hypothetical protein
MSHRAHSRGYSASAAPAERYDDSSDPSDSDSDGSNFDQSSSDSAEEERRVRQREREAEETRRRKAKLLQQTQAGGRFTSVHLAASQATPAISKLHLPKPAAATVTLTSSGSTPTADVSASSTCIVLPCTLQPVESSSVMSYLGSTTSVSSTASTPKTHHAALGRALACVSQELVFSDMVPLAFITFRNFYVAHLTIKQMVVKAVTGDREGRSKQVWTTILHRHTLMTHPHYEGEAQKQWTISVEQVSRAHKSSAEQLLMLPHPQPSHCVLSPSSLCLSVQFEVSAFESSSSPFRLLSAESELAQLPPPRCAMLATRNQRHESTRGRGDSKKRRTIEYEQSRIGTDGP